MHFDQIISRWQDAGRNELTIPDDWAQGRTVYGGLTAALIHHRMQQVVLEDRPNEIRPIRYFDLSFIGPLMVDVPVDLEVTLLRAGRSASQLIAYVKQQGKTCVVAQACFGVDRHSKISIGSAEQQPMGDPRKAKFIPQIPKVVPRFLRHVDINLQAGRLPFMHSRLDYLHGWMRFKQQPSTFSDSHLVALIDAWPCTVLQQLRLPAMASTMNWNLQFPQTASSPEPDHWVAYQATTAQAAAGYVFGDAQVWNRQGELLALSRQTVGVFA